ncbi:hypothetical protein IKE87_01105 [Candidatus Saccharibacteria bacterium]|nr:hypothetical protein [Candidatus Saccharibacteria bacterium]
MVEAIYSKEVSVVLFYFFYGLAANHMTFICETLNLGCCFRIIFLIDTEILALTGRFIS